MLTKTMLYQLPDGVHIRKLGVTFELHHYTWGIELKTVQQDPGYSVWFHNTDPDEQEWLQLAYVWDSEHNQLIQPHELCIPAWRGVPCSGSCEICGLAGHDHIVDDPYLSNNGFIEEGEIPF